MPKKAERTEFDLTFNIETRLMDVLELSIKDIGNEVNQLFKDFLVQRAGQMKMLKKCKMGGPVHTINVLSTTAEWMMSNMINEDRDCTDFVLKQYVDAVDELILQGHPCTEKRLVLSKLSDQMLGLNEVCSSDDSYFSNVRAITAVMNEETMDLISSELGLNS